MIARVKDSRGIENAMGGRLPVAATTKETAEASEAPVQWQQRADKSKREVHRLINQDAYSNKNTG